MSTKAAVSFLLSALVLSLGCDVLSPPAGFPHAVANFMCGPADGPATAITLAREPIPSAGPRFPYVGIMIDQPLSALAGRTFLVGPNGTAGASYVAGPGSVEFASIGRVAVSGVDADSTIHGEVSLWFSSRRVMDTFNADWVYRAALCN